MAPAFSALVKESEARNMPTSYVRDLYYHDRNYIEDDNPPVFGWMLRDCGTHLFDPRYDGLEVFEAAIKTWSDGLLYWWDGTSLEPVSPTEMRMLLATHVQAYDPNSRFKVNLDYSGRTWYVWDTETCKVVERYLSEERAKRLAVWCTNNPERALAKARGE